jgi:two-component system chemotaxis response regulator CheB
MTIKVLVVDDSVMMQMLVTEIVSSDPNLEVVGTADNGKECLACVRELAPDVILLDIEMPIMDGIETLKRLKLVSKARVVVLSSVAQAGSPKAIEAKALGAADVIAKPSGAVSLDLETKRGHLITSTIRRVAKG